MSASISRNDRAGRVRQGLVKAFSLTAAVVLAGVCTIGFPALLFSVAMGGGAALWAATTLRTPIDPARIIVPYLVTVSLFICHVGEEYLGHIERLLSLLLGHAISQSSFLLLAAFFAPIFWLAGAVLMLRRSQLGDFIASVFLFGMIAGEASHFAFPFMEDGTFHYSAGMGTTLPLIGSAVVTLLTVLREVRVGRIKEDDVCVD